MELSSAESPNTFWEVSRRDLFDVMKQSSARTITEQFEILIKYIQKETKTPDSQLQEIKSLFAIFRSQFKKKWTEANRQSEKFLNKNMLWLEGLVRFKKYASDFSKFGRPSTSFEDSSERTKRRRTEELRSKYSGEILAYASQMNLRASGKLETSKLVREVTLTSPGSASKYKQALAKYHEHQIFQITVDDALSMITEARLTRHQYNVVRARDKARFPCYTYVQRAKKQCYPQKETITVTSTCAQIQLQALLDHTVLRLIKLQEELLVTLDDDILNNVVLISKWGIDGTNTTEYKQRFENFEETDSSLLLTSLVPITLISGNPKEKDAKILWQNPRPSSTRYCRPIRVCFQRETVDVTVAEKNRIEEEIKLLTPTDFCIQKRKYNIRHKLLFTMIDGKVCNAISETKSTQRCYICGLTSKDFNNLEKCYVQPINEDTLEFGLSILHAWIRFMECLLHLSYKLPLQKWQARGEKEKKIVVERKKEVQTRFKNELGLLIDKPKHAFGNSNDGNTARCVFENASITACITNIDEELVQRFHTVLQTIACGFAIDSEKFNVYCLDTAKYFIEKYPWYIMPPTVHKILVHGPTVISRALLPIGQLSEEAQEARNKDFKRYIRDYSRKCSRMQTNEDILNNLLVSSDPFITSFRQLPQKKFRNLPTEVIVLLKPPEVMDSTDSDKENDPDTSDDDDSNESK